MVPIHDINMKRIGPKAKYILTLCFKIGEISRKNRWPNNSPKFIHDNNNKG